MKIAKGFVLSNVGGEHVVMAIGAASMKLNGMIRLNASGVEMWNMLKEGAEEEELAAALVKEYGITAERARQDVGAFLAILRPVGCIEE